MPQATRLGDFNTGHDACPAVPLITSSENVLINGKGAGRKTDIYASHDCDVHPLHQDSINAGSTTVLINGLPAARKGDAVSIGGTVDQSSQNVFVGDEYVRGNRNKRDR